MKKRFAVWTHGGIGTGHYSQGYPLMDKLVIGLADDFDIVVYSHVSPNLDYRPAGFLIFSPPAGLKSGTLRWIYLVSLFLIHHIKKKYHGLFSFWGYPAGVFVVVLGKIFRVPSMVNLLGGDSVGIASIRYGVMCNPRLKKLCIWTYERASTLTVLSAFQVAMLKKHGLKREPHVIPWGADPNDFPFKSEKRQQETLQIIHVASLTPIKDQYTLLKAFQLLSTKKPAMLKVLGADYMNGEIQKLAEKLNIADRVSFVGIIPYRDVGQYYEQADMMMHTSLSEGQSLALTEAAMSGVLLAGTRVGLISDLSEEGAIVVEPGKFEELAKKIIELYDDQELWRQKVLHARNWAVKHDINWTIKSLKSLMHKI